MEPIAARWANSERTLIEVRFADGGAGFAPARPENRMFRRVAEGDPDSDLAPLLIEEPKRFRDAGEARRKLIEEVKAEALRRISRVAPEWKQRNMIARAVELLEAIVAGKTLSPVETAERAAIEDAWARVKALRAASDAKETDIIALGNDEKALDDYDVNADWPE